MRQKNPLQFVSVDKTFKFHSHKQQMEWTMNESMNTECYVQAIVIEANNLEGMNWFALQKKTQHPPYYLLHGAWEMGTLFNTQIIDIRQMITL